MLSNYHSWQPKTYPLIVEEFEELKDRAKGSKQKDRLSRVLIWLVPKEGLEHSELLSLRLT